MSDHEIETSRRVSVTSEEFARQITAVTDPLSQRLALLCEFIRELKNEQSSRRHEGTASPRTACSSSAAAEIALKLLKNCF